MPPLHRNTHKPDTGPVPLTPAGLERLQNRLVELKASLPRLIEDASQAAAQGDRSDNDAYKQSKGLLRRTHRQIWAIEDQLKRVVVIESGRSDDGAIRLGSRVSLMSEDGKEKIFEIVGSYETNPSRGRISHESPLGKALIGHTENEKVSVTTASSGRSYIILKVE